MMMTGIIRYQIHIAQKFSNTVNEASVDITNLIPSLYISHHFISIISWPLSMHNNRLDMSFDED